MTDGSVVTNVTVTNGSSVVVIILICVPDSKRVVLQYEKKVNDIH